MAIDTSKTTGARTGEQFLAGLRGDDREIWLEGERITDPSSTRSSRGRRARSRDSSTSSTRIPIGS